VVVFVNPQTKVQTEEKAGKFTDLREGVSVRANVNVRDGRHTASQVVVPPKRK
jgi:hypothetical protein